MDNLKCEICGAVNTKELPELVKKIEGIGEVCNACIFKAQGVVVDSIEYKDAVSAMVKKELQKRIKKATDAQ